MDVWMEGSLDGWMDISTVCFNRSPGRSISLAELPVQPIRPHAIARPPARSTKQLPQEGCAAVPILLLSTLDPSRGLVREKRGSPGLPLRRIVAEPTSPAHQPPARRARGGGRETQRAG